MNIDENLNSLEGRLGYVFRDKFLLRQAMTHRSYASETAQAMPDNENLEFLGDAVIELIISHMLFERYSPRFREGDLTKMRAYLVSEPRLFERASSLGIGQCLLLSRGEEKSGGRNRPSILADAFEAVTGAIFLDGGYEAASSFLNGQFAPLIKAAPDKGLLIDHKSRLQELTQKRLHIVPTYKLIKASGPDHSRSFTVALFFDEQEISRGSGHTKKEAEQQAAKAAIENLEGMDSQHGSR